MSDQPLIPYQETPIVKADRQISIANKALVRIDAQRFAKLLARHYIVFIRAVSYNEDLIWTEELIERYE